MVARQSVDHLVAPPNRTTCTRYLYSLATNSRPPSAPQPPTVWVPLGEPVFSDDGKYLLLSSSARDFNDNFGDQIPRMSIATFNAFISFLRWLRTLLRTRSRPKSESRQDRGKREKEKAKQRREKPKASPGREKPYEKPRKKIPCVVKVDTVESRAESWSGNHAGKL